MPKLERLSSPQPAAVGANPLDSELTEAELPSVSLFGTSIHQVDMHGAVDWAVAGMKEDFSTCQLIFTPNVNHVVQLSENLDFVKAYADASLVIADGWPIVSASKWLGKPLPCRVPGSSLVPALMSFKSDQWSPRVFLLGGASGVPEQAARNAQEQWPWLNIVGSYSPPFGFERDADECRRIIELIASSQPDLLVVGFGAPKQEIWLAQHRRDLQAKVAIAAGATIDFLAGRQQRAPKWVQRLRLEWLHRLATNPRRLIGRYSRDAIVFPWLMAKEIYAGD